MKTSTFERFEEIVVSFLNNLFLFANIPRLSRFRIITHNLYIFLTHPIVKFVLFPHRGGKQVLRSFLTLTLVSHYAFRKEKTWTVHSSCKLQTRSVGWTIFLPWCVYYFSSYPGRKYHIRVFETGTKVVLKARFFPP